MTAPISSHQVSGLVKDRHGTLVVGATVTITHSSIEPVLSETSNSAGEYIINLSGLDSQWTSGDSISVKATTSTQGRITVTTTIQGVGGQTVNLSLAETSDFNFGENTFDKHNLYFAVLTDYAGNKITSINPLPVETTGDRNINDPAIAFTITRGDKQPDSETITLVNGDRYTRTFTYSDNVQITRSLWEKQ